MSGAVRRKADEHGQSQERGAGLRHFLDLRDFDPTTLRQMLDVASGKEMTPISLVASRADLSSAPQPRW